jgi:hypothetical protein
MKTPAAVEEKIAELGRRVLDGESEADIGEEAAHWLLEHHLQFALVVVLESFVERIQSRRRGLLASVSPPDGGDDGRLPVPFPELPEMIEIAPDVVKHQMRMTRRDWENAVAHYRFLRDGFRRLVLEDDPEAPLDAAR